MASDSPLTSRVAKPSAGATPKRGWKVEQKINTDGDETNEHQWEVLKGNIPGYAEFRAQKDAEAQARWHALEIERGMEELDKLIKIIDDDAEASPARASPGGTPDTRHPGMASSGNCGINDDEGVASVLSKQ